MVVVRILSGPRRGERFATRLDGLTDGTHFCYLGEEYTFVRDAVGGRWGARPVIAMADHPGNP